MPSSYSVIRYDTSYVTYSADHARGLDCSASGILPARIIHEGRVGHTVPVVGEAQARAPGTSSDYDAAATIIGAWGKPPPARGGFPADADAVGIAGLTARRRVRVIDADEVVRTSHHAPTSEVAAGLVSVVAVLHRKRAGGPEQVAGLWPIVLPSGGWFVWSW